MEDLVSIIMPSYNTARVIRDTIDSVLNQTYKNWELIIVDDCSDDDTDEILKGYIEDARIKYYRNPRNLGAALTRNRALRKARGRWVAFLDSDDLWKPDKLRKQIAFMKRNKISFSYTAYSEMDENGNLNGKIITGPKRITKSGFYNYCWPGCLTVMYDREIIGLIQVTDIKKNNDYAMWLKACKKADCYFLNKNLAVYRRGRSGSISTHSILSMIKWHYMLFRIAEKQSVLFSLINTGRNIVFGITKKIIYVKKIRCINK